MRSSALRGIAIAGITSIVLAGCGGGDSAGSDDGDLVVGVLWAQTGPASGTGKRVLQAAELAAEEINADGGIDGRDLTVKAFDAKANPETATQEAQRAASEGVVAIVGPQSSSEALAVGEVAERSKLPTIVNAAAANAVTEDRKFVFRVQAPARDLAAGFVDTAVDTLKGKKLLSIHDETAFGVDLDQNVKQYAKSAGVTIDDTVAFEAASTDLTPQVNRIAAINPDVVILSNALGADSGLLARQMVEAGIQSSLIGTTTIGFADSLEVARGAIDKLPGGVYSVLSVDPSKAEYDDFKSKYEKKFGAVEGTFEDPVVQSYDSVYLLAEALKASDGKGGQDLATALEGLEPRAGVTGREGSEQHFGKDHEAYETGKFVSPFKWEDGAFVLAK